MTDSTVKLSRPVKIDGKQVTQITLREPGTGEMRGLKLTELFQGSVNQLLLLIPRISTPHLTQDQIAAMPVRDAAALFGGVMGFFTDGEEEAAPAMPES